METGVLVRKRLLLSIFPRNKDAVVAANSFAGVVVVRSRLLLLLLLLVLLLLIGKQPRPHGHLLQKFHDFVCLVVSLGPSGCQFLQESVEFPEEAFTKAGKRRLFVFVTVVVVAAFAAAAAGICICIGIGIGICVDVAVVVVVTADRDRWSRR